MKKQIISLIILFSTIFPLFVFADGMVIWPEYDRWRFRNEESQQAYINYENGIEKMIISVGLKEETGSGVWLFPVPAKPEKVVIDVVDQSPSWYGSDVFESAKHKLSEVRRSLTYTQGYPIFFPQRIYYAGYKSPVADINSLPSLGADAIGGVTVHEHLDKEGITTEIITAKTSVDLYEYLKNKNLNIAVGSIPVLNNYIGRDYTFIVSWLTENSTINATSTNPAPMYYDYYYPKQRNRGLFVAFPTDKAYYPLMPTSVYESKVVPATIFVKGFVDPEIFKDIEPYTNVSYSVDEYSDKTPQIFYSGQDAEEITKYTTITINSPSKLLTDDLWIKGSAPGSVNYAFFMYAHPIIVFSILLAIISAIAGLLSGLISFREARSFNSVWKFLIIGLFNCLTILGLIVAAIFSRTKNIKLEDTELFNELKRKGYSSGGLRMSDWRKLLFVPVFSILFLGLSYFVVYILGLGL